MDLDQLARTVKDLEYRVRALEKAREPKPRFTTGMTLQTMTWCECGRDVCRAPDYPSHKPDPMGR